MKRFALIIEASETDDGPLPGAKADAEGYWNWLYSKPGGDWFDTEMVRLHTPTVAEVKKAVEAAGKVDYVFVAFSGHGYHAKELDLTKVCLKDGRMTVRQLVPNTDRGTVVIDACRNVMAEIFTKSFSLSLAESRKYAKFAEERNFRQDFETQVGKAEKGLIFMYSCDLDESAGESRRGGYFSRLLLDSGEEFAARNEDGTMWFSTKGAFNRTAAATTDRNPQQHPQYEPGRRLVHFPFAV